ncbi:MAG: sulfurtransferase TusA family protein [Candidatus Thorarchaeota archaeon]
MHNGDAEILVDITGLTCPIPLIKARKAIKNASKGQIIKFIGTDKEEISRKEIIIAVSNLNHPLLEDLYDNDREWHILIKKN